MKIKYEKKYGIYYALLSLLFVASIAYGLDRVIKAPSGKLILDSQSTVDVSKPLQVEGSLGVTGNLTVSADSGGSVIKSERTNSTTTGAFGSLGFANSDGLYTSSVSGWSDENNDYGELRFSTTKTPNSNPYALTTAMTIDSSGDVSMTGNLYIAKAISNNIYNSSSTDTDFDAIGKSTIRHITSSQTINTINGSSGQILYIMVASGSVVLAHNVSGTYAPIRTNTGSSITIGANGGVTLLYDSSTPCWRIVGLAN